MTENEAEINYYNCGPYGHTVVYMIKEYDEYNDYEILYKNIWVVPGTMNYE